MTVYEIIIRGDYAGRFAGAHQIDWVTETQTGPAKPLDPAAVGTLLGAAFPGLANDIAAANARVAELEAEVTALKAAVPAPPPQEAVHSISDRQFAQGLAARKLITETEALAWVRDGTLPAAIAAYVEALPEDQRFAAKMVLCGAVEFRFSSPHVAAFASAVGMDDVALREFWDFCGSL
jgi:hypothetical protein